MWGRLDLFHLTLSPQLSDFVDNCRRSLPPIWSGEAVGDCKKAGCSGRTSPTKTHKETYCVVLIPGAQLGAHGGDG